MFPSFFFGLRSAGVPVGLTEYLALMAALEAGLADRDVDTFYFLARSALVKDERHLDRFDRVFARAFRGAVDGTVAAGDPAAPRTLPEEWLRKLAERHLTEEEKREIEALGGWETLMDTLAKRLQEQQGRHQGGSKWIGTAGTSPFGAYGYNPEGVRIGQAESRHRRAVKVWDRREFRDLDDTVEIDVRAIKVALRRLRVFARSGAAEHLDLHGTIDATAKQGGWLDLKLERERHNAAKVLLFFDVGGSMDDHVRICEQLFSAARSEFKHMEYFYFHNCPYEGLWRENRRRHTDVIPTWDVIHTYGRDYRAVFVGDACMSPYEISHAGGSVEHWNREPGRVWLQRLIDAFPKAAWINPTSADRWGYFPSCTLVREVVEDRMFPLTLDGLDRAMRALT